MNIAEWLTIIALLAGPILAVQISELLERRREKRRRRLELFRQLMSTRAAGLTAAHVQGLNLIDIEFHGVRRVIDAWRAYIDHLNTPQAPSLENWIQRGSDFLTDLLAEMAASLGYDFNKALIRSSAYYPRGYGEADVEHTEIRKAVLRIVSGTTALKVETVNSSEPEIARKQQEIADGLHGLVSGDAAIKVKVDSSAPNDSTERHSG